MNRSSRTRDTQRIVVRRKSRIQEQGPQMGSWKIAYADYMTAMMAFFLVMWLLSLIPKSDLKEIAEYFRTPLLEAIRGGPNIGDLSGTPIPNPAASSPALVPLPVPSHGSTPGAGTGQGVDRGRLEGFRTELDTLIETDPVLTKYRPQLLLDMTPAGLRVQIVDQQNRPMFDLGSARMRPEMTEVLRALAPMFNRLPNRITLAGHTDSIQYATGEREYSNWELSADRANAARKVLVAGGLDEDKVKQVLGLSSTVNLVKDDPTAAVNRRISIVVLSQQAERRIDAQAHAGESAVKIQEILSESGSQSAEPGWSAPAGPNEPVAP